MGCMETLRRVCWRELETAQKFQYTLFLCQFPDILRREVSDFGYQSSRQNIRNFLPGERKYGRCGLF